MHKQTVKKMEISREAHTAGPAILNEIERLEAQIKGLSQRVSGPSARPALSSSTIRSILRARQERSEHFSSTLFADPAWEILLELFALELEQRRVSVSKLCLSARVPTTTALRWIDKLHEEGLISRGEDPFDGRRIWVTLSPAGVVRMQSYFNSGAVNALPI